jgi:hypothetical protein
MLLAVLSSSIVWPILILTGVVLLSALGGAASRSSDGQLATKNAWRRYGIATAVLVGAAGLIWFEARIAAPGISLRAMIARSSGVLMVATLIAVPIRTIARYHSLPAAGAHEPLLIVALALLCVPLLGFVLSKAITPVFVDRYFLPSTIGVSIIVASATELTITALGGADHTPGTGRTPGVVRLAWACLLLALAVRPVWTSLEEPRPQRPGAALEAVVPAHAVVIVETMLDFMPLLHYQQRPDIEYVHPMDRTVVEDPRARRGAEFGFHYLSVLREHGYLRASSPDPSSPLCTYARLVVARGLDTLWFALRIAADSTLATEPLTVPGATHDSVVALAVHARASDTARPCIPGVEGPS